MNASDRKEEEDYEVGDRFSLPLDNEDYENENYPNNNNNNKEYPNNNNNEYSNNNNEYSNNNNNSNFDENNTKNASNNTENVSNNGVTIPTSEEETTGSELALLGDDAERYKDDDAFLQDTLMPIMRSYFPTDPSENGEKNILMGVLKHDAIVIVKVKQLMENGTDNNEDFVEMVEEYTDDEYMDKETIEDTLELTLKYVTGLKSSIDSYVEYEFFCSSIPGYKQFVEEMLQYRVVMRLNRHMFYKELHGYLHKEVFDNYDFNTAIFDFDSEVNEFVKENKRRGRNNNNKKNTSNKKPATAIVPLTANNYTNLSEEQASTGIINANKMNTSRVGSSIFGTVNATANTTNATVGTANSTANSTANATVGTANTANATVGTANATATPTLMNQITSAVTGTAAPTATPAANATPAPTATPAANATPAPTATPQPTLLNQLATATGFKTAQKGGRITPRQGHTSSRFTRRH